MEEIGTNQIQGEALKRIKLGRLLKRHRRNVTDSWDQFTHLTGGSGTPTSLKFGIFLHSIYLSVIGLPPRYGWSLLMSCCTLLNYEAGYLSGKFDSRLENAGAGSLTLSFGEAIIKLLPVMTHSALFMMCYPLILLLACPLPLILQIIFIIMLIFIFLFYFPELIDKVSTTGIVVDCGSFKLRLIWFTISGTVVLSLICILLILIGMYFIWRYVLKGKPSLKEPGGDMKILTQILVGS